MAPRVQFVDVLREHAGNVCVDELLPLFDLSQPTLSRAIAAGQLEASRLTQGRGGWRIRPEAIDAWLETRSNGSAARRPLGDVSRVPVEQIGGDAI